jgi:hypothetical protein
MPRHIRTPRGEAATAIASRETRERSDCLTLPDGRIIDLIRDRSSSRFQLVLSDGFDHEVVDRFDGDGCTIVPPTIDPNLERAICWPTAPADFGSTEDLFAAVQGMFTEHGLPQETASAFSYFAFATWFPDRLLYVPRVVFTASEFDSNFLFGLLRCVVRRGLRLADLGSASLLAAVEKVQPTLLIDARHLTRRQLGILSASSGPRSYLPWNHTVVDVHFAAVIYVGPVPMPQHGAQADTPMEINVPICHWSRSILDEATFEKIATALQPKLLAYRLRNLRHIQGCAFDVAEAEVGTRILGHALASCFPGATKLQAGVRKLLEAHEERLRAARWTDRACVTIEVLLAACHAEAKKQLTVGEVAKDVAALLEARGGDDDIKPRSVGPIIRSLALQPKRCAPGYRFPLTREVRRRIHELARDRRVEAAREEWAGCEDCHEVLAPRPGQKE